MIDYSIAIMSAQPGTKKADVTETKAYGTAQVREKLDLNKFAKHITDHGCAYDRGDVAAVLTKAVDCLREMMLAGNKVTLGDLGSFHPELQTEGAVTTEDFTSDNIKAVNVCWRPGKLFRDLRSDAEFKLVPKRSQQTDAVKVIKNTDTIHVLE